MTGTRGYRMVRVRSRHVPGLPRARARESKRRLRVGLQVVAVAVEVQVAQLVLRLAEEVRDSGESRLLTRQDEELAILSPAKPTRRTRKSGIVTRADSLWSIVGMASSSPL